MLGPGKQTRPCDLSFADLTSFSAGNFNKKLENVVIYSRQQKHRRPAPAERFMPRFQTHKETSPPVNSFVHRFETTSDHKILEGKLSIHCKMDARLHMLRTGSLLPQHVTTSAIPNNIPAQPRSFLNICMC